MGLLTTTMADAVGGASAVNGNMNGQSSSYASKFNLAPHFIGGNELSQAAPSSVKDFVAANDGHTVITNVSDRLLQGPPMASRTL
jgi:acetyl-CoA carboxylase/biotin carboxylase 1